MRKILWTAAILTLMAGVYWSVAHATVHPHSPVGRTFTWFGINRTTPAPTQLTSIAPMTCNGGGCGESASQILHVQAHKPAGLIVIEPDFTPMPDPDGNEALPGVIVRSEPVRDVVLSEEFRIMPEVEPIEEPRPAAPKGQVTVSLKLSAECPCCPLDLICNVKLGDCCRVFSFASLSSYLHGKIAGIGCPLVACQKAIARVCGKDCPAACAKEGCKECPAQCKQCPAHGTARIERLTEAPVAVTVEESEPVTPVKKDE